MYTRDRYHSNSLRCKWRTNRVNPCLSLLAAIRPIFMHSHVARCVNLAGARGSITTLDARRKNVSWKVSRWCRGRRRGTFPFHHIVVHHAAVFWFTILTRYSETAREREREEKRKGEHELLDYECNTRGIHRLSFFLFVDVCLHLRLLFSMRSHDRLLHFRPSALRQRRIF